MNRFGRFLSIHRRKIRLKPLFDVSPMSLGSGLESGLQSSPQQQDDDNDNDDNVAIQVDQSAPLSKRPPIIREPEPEIVNYQCINIGRCRIPNEKKYGQLNDFPQNPYYVAKDFLKYFGNYCLFGFKNICIFYCRQFN